MSEKRRIVTNTLANGIAQLSSMLSGLVFLPLLIGRFGMTDYGLYLVSASIMGYASLLDLGVGSAVVKNVAEMSARDEPARIRKVVSTALAFYIGVAFVSAIVIVTLALNSSALFHVTADGARLLRNLLLVAAASSLISWPMNTAGAVLQGFQRYTILARTTVFVVMANIVVTVAVLVLRQGPLVLLAATSLVGIAGALTNVFFAVRELGGLHGVSPYQAERSVFRAMAAFSWPVFTFQVVALVIGAQTDRLVIGMFMGAAFVTLYEGAAKFPAFVGQVNGLMTGAVMPVASQLSAQNRTDALSTLFLRGTKYTVALVTPIIVTFMVLAGPILTRWLGPQFTNQALTVRILLSYWTFQAVAFFGFNIIVGLGKLKKRLPYLVFLVTLGNLVLSLALVRPFGITGVVLGTAIPQIIDLPFNIRFMVKETHTRWDRFWREVVLRTYPILIVPLVASLLLLRTPLMGSLAGVVLATAVSVASYFAAFAVFGLNSTERAELGGLVRHVRTRFASGPAD